MSIVRGIAPGRVINLFDPEESATVEALRLRGLGLGKIAREAGRLFGRPVGKSTIQTHLAILARRQERDAEVT